MEYTTNYHLPQWVKSDRIMMDDFNDAMAAMEEGMSSAANTANAAASTANAAQSLAQQTAGAAYTPDNKPYAVGLYQGLGTESQDIVVGFKPSIVILFAQQQGGDYFAFRIVAAGRQIGSGRVTMIENGFRLSPQETDPRFPMVNYKGEVYEYIAFK